MELRVLGCSGGIGAGRKTTSFLIDGEILVDAGSGVGSLTLEEMTRIRHIFLTHSHLDHVHCIPLLLDSIFDSIQQPILIHAQPDTIKAVQEHVFNGVMWPDFSRLPHPERPVTRFVATQPGEVVRVGELGFEMIPVNHSVPAVGYRITSPGGVVAFSGDTTTNDTFWAGLNRYAELDLLLVECAFSNAEAELCRLSRHYCPQMLADDLRKLKHTPTLYLTHAKPGEEAQIFEQCRDSIEGREINHLTGDEIFTL